MIDALERPQTRYVRWLATIHYRGDAGLVSLALEMEEIDELASHVEHGPHWDTIERIDIVRALVPASTMTLEESGRQC